MLKPDNKFKFTTEFQWDLLRFTVQDKLGEQALKKYDDDYFTLIEHQVLAHALITFYKKEKRIPGETMLRENIVNLLTSKQFINLVTKDDQKTIIDLIKPMYHTIVKDGDKIYESVKDFRNYIRIKSLMENVDINDYTKYEQFSKQLALAIIDEDKKDDLQSSFLLDNIKERQFRRQQKTTIFPTPFTWINKLTNAGGYEAGSVLVILDREKKGKTKVLVNVARGYLKMRKKILVIDFENGRDNYMSRFEQSIMGISKQELLSGVHDVNIQKRFRKYKRLGGEVVILRMPALITNCNDIQSKIDELYRDFGFKPDQLILDYAAKMASITKREDDHKRISDIYLELQNLALKNDIEHIWTANHVTREGVKLRERTRYIGADIASCIDIVRHAQAIFGLNRTSEEEEAGYLRMEIVSQRDGQPTGRAVFKTNDSTQRIEELSTQERKEYDEDIFPLLMSQNKEGNKVSKKERKNDFAD